MSIDPRPNSLVISRGAVLDVRWKGNYAGATAAQLVFYSTTGILSAIDGTVTADTVAFLHTDVATLDAIPHGTPYEMFITVAGNPYKQFYGTVVRREACAFADTVRAIT